jgi:hypothetical protein
MKPLIKIVVSPYSIITPLLLTATSPVSGSSRYLHFHELHKTDDGKNRRLFIFISLEEADVSATPYRMYRYQVRNLL